MNTLDLLTRFNMTRAKIPRLVNEVKETAYLYAQKESEYRQLLTTEAMRLNKEQGVVWSVCESLAKGSPGVARARQERDELDGRCKTLKIEIEALKLELELQERELEREYKIRRVS